MNENERQVWVYETKSVKDFKENHYVNVIKTGLKETGLSCVVPVRKYEHFALDWHFINPLKN